MPELTEAHKVELAKMGVDWTKFDWMALIVFLAKWFSGQQPMFSGKDATCTEIGCKCQEAAAHALESARLSLECCECCE